MPLALVQEGGRKPGTFAEYYWTTPQEWDRARSTSA
jgi:hypothetical protein